MLSKLQTNNIGNIETGEIYPDEVIESIVFENKRIREKELKRELNKKYENKTITKEELIVLMKLEKENTNSKIYYNSFFIVNMNKNKPEKITDGEYGKFFKMLNYLSYRNTISHTNGKAIKKEDLSIELNFTNIRAFKRYINKLTEHKMIGMLKLGVVEYLVVNPAYAQRNMVINATIFNMFKDDLIEFLTPKQIMLLEFEEDDTEIDSVIPLI